jgi:hypothetical protein
VASAEKNGEIASSHPLGLLRAQLLLISAPKRSEALVLLAPCSAPGGLVV